MAGASLIAPHGGTLIDRIADPERGNVLRERAERLPEITLTPKQACDLEMISIGAFSPLRGFIKQAEFDSICSTMRMTDGTLFPIPIVLAVDDETKDKLTRGSQAALRHPDGTLLALMDTASIYPHEKETEVRSVFGTNDPAHPGVKTVLDEGDWCVGGSVHSITVTPEHEPGEQFPEYRLMPKQTRAEFGRRGWRTVVAFQTRNPIHRAHEYLTKCALEICDGLLIHPLVGETKPGDIPADVRMRCYTALIDNYYNKDRTLLAVMPAAMRYAGPREAVLHAIIRKNYGCSHFIVGRDHAGVGDYYGTYDAQRIFDQIKFRELGMQIIRFENTFFCRKTDGMASDKTTNSPASDRIFLAGTKVREMLRNGERPPAEFTRPEIAEILLEWAQSELAAAT